MSEQPENATVEERQQPLAGERLAEARRLRDISILDIAKELHLDEPKVRALEQNRFDALGAPVFVKGYIRKYAEVVGIPGDEVLADYRQFERPDEPLPVVGLRKPPRPEVPAGPWLGAILAVAVVAGVAWLWLSGSLDPIFSPREPATLAPFEPDAPATGDAAAPREPGPGTGDADSEPPEEADAPAPMPADPVDDGVAAVQDAPPPVETPPAAPPREGQVGLTLSFSGDCWTEVSDASGSRLYFGLGQAGQEVSVAGTAPLRVLLGNSEYATLRVDGEAFPIPPSARRGATARLTITGR